MIMPRLCAFRTEKRLGSGLIGSFRKLRAAGENIPVFWRTAGMKVPLWPTQFFFADCRYRQSKLLSQFCYLQFSHRYFRCFHLPCYAFAAAAAFWVSCWFGLRSIHIWRQMFYRYFWPALPILIRYYILLAVRKGRHHIRGWGEGLSFRGHLRISEGEGSRGSIGTTFQKRFRRSKWSLTIFKDLFISLFLHFKMKSWYENKNKKIWSNFFFFSNFKAQNFLWLAILH